MPYQENSHYEMISLWYKDHGLLPVDSLLFPEIGYVVPGVAAGFLYKTDSKLGIIENIISNKRSEKNERDRSLNAIVENLIITAQALGMRLLVAFTELPVVSTRAKFHGFEKVNGPQIQLVRWI